MQIMNLLVNLLVIAVCFVNVIDYVITSTCYHKNLEKFWKVHFLGEVNNTGNECGSTCVVLRKTGLPINRFVSIENTTCLCIEDNEALPSSVPCIHPIRCNIFSTTCPINPYSMETFESCIVQRFNWSLPFPIIVNTSFKINRAEHLNVGYIFDNEMEIKNFTKDSMIRLYTGSYHRLKITAKSCNYSIEKTMFVYLSEDIRWMHFTDVKVLETHVQKDILLYISSGTNMTLQINNGNLPTKSYFADIYEGMIGYYSEELTVSTKMADGVYVVPSMTFDEDGTITKILCSFDVGGGDVMDVIIFRPICKSGEMYSMSVHGCVGNNDFLSDSVDLLTNETQRPYPQTWIAPTLKLIQKIFLKKSSSGYFIKNYKLQVKKNDIVGYVQSPQSANIVFTSWVPVKVYRLSSNYDHHTGSIVSSVALNGSPVIPLIQIYYSKLFGHRMSVMAKTPGQYIVSADAENFINKVTVTKRYNVQDRIYGLKLSENNPREASTSSHALNELLLMKASVVQGTEVEYIFTIKDLQLTKISTSGEVTFSINRTGIFTLEVLVSNLVNQITGIKRQFRIVKPIKGIYLTVSKLNLDKDEIFNIRVHIIEGTNITLEVDFGDKESPFVDFIDDAGNGVFRSINHSYAKESIFIVKAKVQNNDTWEIFQLPYNDTAIIMVGVLSSDLRIETNPKLSITNDIILSFDAALNLTISLLKGSYPVFHIDWGDSQINIEDQSTKKIPVFFSMIHQYQTKGNFSINVTAFLMNTRIEKNITVEVVDCAKPELLFQHGSENKRKVLFRNDHLNIKGVWIAPVDDLKCMKEIANDYKLKHWELFKVNENGAEILVENISTGFSIYYFRVLYTIPLEENQGDYDLRLTMTYRGKEFIYTAYITLLIPNLIAKIHNEQFQTIPYQVIRDDGNQSFHNFKLNGNESFDSYNIENGTNGIEFKWYCRLASNETVVNRSITTRSSYTLVPFEQTLCQHINWIGNNEAISTNITPIFNTEKFLRNVEYEFKLQINKGHRKSSTMQNVLMVNGKPPKVDLKYIEISENNGEKVNINKLLAFKLTGCETNTTYTSVWTIMLDSEPETDVMAPVTSTGNCYNHILIVPPNTLKPSKNYTFTLAIKYINEFAKGIFKIKRMTSETPYGGNCGVEGPSNITVPSTITILCTGWKSQDWPIKYEFYQTPQPNTKYRIQKEDSASAINFRPAVGDQNKEYLNEITVVILNKYQQYEEFVIGVYVRPPSEKLNIGSILKKTSNNQDEILNIVIMVMSTLVRTTKDDISAQNNGNHFGNISIERTFEEQEKLKNETKFKTEELKNLINVVTTVIHDNTTDRSIERMVIFTKVIKAAISYPEVVYGDVLGFCTETLLLINNKALGLDNHVTGRQKLNDFGEAMSKALDDAIERIENPYNRVEEIGSTAATVKLKQDKLEEAHKNRTRWFTQLRKSVNTLVYILAQNQLPGEKEKEIIRKNFDIFVWRVPALSVFSNATTLSATEDQMASGFVIKNLDGLFNNSYFGKPVNTLRIIFKTNMYPEIDGSENIISEEPSLEFRSLDNRELIVNNTDSPVIIKIKNLPNKLKKQNISLFMPGKMKFHTMKLKRHCNQLLTFQLFDDFINGGNILYVYIQYGEAPSVSDYDVKLTFNKSSIVQMSLNNDILIQTINDTNTSRSIRKRRHSNVYLANDQTLVMWEANNSNLYLSLLYEGKMPPLTMQENYYTYDQLESRGVFNISMISACAECSFIDTKSAQNPSWSTQGCRLIPNKTSLTMTVCECNHLTTFGSFFVEPNSLKQPSLTLLKESYALLVAVTTTLLLYLVGLLFTRRADLADESKIGVAPLPDNKPEDRYLYEITVNTGNRRKSGTHSQVYFQLGGDLGETSTRALKDSVRKTFQRCNSDVFVMATQSSLGEISHLRIWHDNSGGGWYLRSIEVIDLQINKKFVFIASRWLAVEKEDGRIDMFFFVTGQLELKEFNYVFDRKARNELNDSHIWFSIYARPPRSPFTRCQRLSVALSLLFAEMTASCIFYGAVPKDNPEQENRFSNFAFKLQHVYVAIISASITIPIHVILVGLFRSIRQPTYVYDSSNNNENIASDECESISTSQENDQSPSNENIIQRTTSTPKKDTLISIPDTRSKNVQFTLPQWFLFPTWAVCICMIFGFAFMVVWYGLSFGNKKSLNWMTAVSICLIQDILLIQPVKILVIALFVALLYKKVNEEEKSEFEKSAKSLTKNEKWLYPPAFGGNGQNILTRAENKLMEPLNNKKVQEMKELRMTELKMNSISREITLYFLFACVVFAWSFMARNYLSYHQTVNLEQMMHLKTTKRVSNKYKSFFPYKKCHSQRLIWDCIEDMLLPEMYPKKWFNLSESLKNNIELYEFPGRVYLNDVNSKVVTGVRIRQVRMVEGSCKKPSAVSSFISNACIGGYSSYDELDKDFAHNWSIPKTYKIKMNPLDMPWRYQTWNELNGFPIMAELNSYYGGGYVVELFPKWDNNGILKGLRMKRWTDRNTRAIIIEFSVYNANTNYFDSIFIVFELPPGGGVIHYHFVCTFNLYRYTNQYAFFTILCEVLFAIFMIVFAVREMRFIYREGWNYFKEFWNLVEFSNIILSVLAVSFNLYRDILAKNLLKELPTKKPNKFINLQFAAYWDLMFTYILSLICFFVTLKFIKLLRFNRRISMLSSTLKRAWYPLLVFGILLGIVLIAVTVSSTIIFGKALYGYRDNFQSFTSIIGLLLGKSSYHQFDNTNRFLGRVFFLSFNIMVNWIIMNMYISILNDAFAEVQKDMRLQQNDYEMVDYFVNNLKGWLGMQHQTTAQLVEVALNKNNEEEKGVEEELEEEFSRLSPQTSRLLTAFSKQNPTPQVSKYGIPPSQNLSPVDPDEVYMEEAKQSYQAIESKAFSADLPSFLLIEEEEDENWIDETVGKLVECLYIIQNEYKITKQPKKKKEKKKKKRIKLPTKE